MVTRARLPPHCSSSLWTFGDWENTDPHDFTVVNINEKIFVLARNDVILIIVPVFHARNVLSFILVLYMSAAWKRASKLPTRTPTRTYYVRTRVSKQ